MANIKANIKNIRKIKKQRARNKHEISTTRTKIKAVRTTKDQKTLSASYKKLDSVCAKGKIHKNKANRLKSRLAKAVNKNKQATETTETKVTE